MFRHSLPGLLLPLFVTLKFISDSEAKKTVNPMANFASFLIALVVCSFILLLSPLILFSLVSYGVYRIINKMVSPKKLNYKIVNGWRVY